MRSNFHGDLFLTHGLSKRLLLNFQTFEDFLNRVYAVPLQLEKTRSSDPVLQVCGVLPRYPLVVSSVKCPA